MPSNFETLVFEIIAKDAQASAAFDRFRRNVDQTSASLDKNSSQLDKNAQSLDKHKQSAVSASGAAIGLGVALGAMSVPLAAAGAGVAAFAGVALPSLVKITKAVAAPGGLAAAWGTLDNRQRNAVTGVQALGDRYSALAHAMEPRVFQVFNTGLALANSLLGPAGKLAASAGTGFESFLVQFSRDAGLQHFVSFLAQYAGPALALLGRDVTGIAHAVFTLLESFGGVGLAELKLFTTALTGLTSGIAWLAQHVPVLTNVALSIGGIAFALAKIGALSGVLKITGLSSIATQLAGFTAATEGATLAEKGLLAQTTVLEAITPWGWAILGAAALGGLVFWLSRFKSSTDNTITSIERQSKAQGFNTAGYVAAQNALIVYNHANEQSLVTLRNLHTGMVTGTATIGKLTGASAALTAAQVKETAAAQNQNRFLAVLQQAYGLTRGQAISLAVHSGVLASEVNKGGQSMKDATAKAEAYASANLKAQRPTSQLAQDMGIFANKTLNATDRVKGLTDALNLFFNPAVAADQDTIQLKDDQVALAKALHDSSGKTGLLTQKQRDARGAFDTYITQVAQTATDTFKATGRTSDYKRIIDASLPILERAAGHNAKLRQEIQKLIDTERHLPPSEHTKLTVTAFGRTIFGGAATHAAGWRVPGYGGGDRVPALLEGGETVVPKHLTPLVAPLMKANKVPGFAAGGLVGDYAGPVAGIVPWVPKAFRSLTSALTHDMGSHLAKSFAASFAASGGGMGGAGVARWAGLVREVLAMLGQPQSDLGVVLRQMATESGGNPRAINLTDINARMGDPSRGLMQTIGSTFNAYAGPFRGLGIYNPLANIYAGLNYAIHRYGAGWTQVLGHGHGYDSGGYLPPGVSLAVNGTGRPERVLGPGQGGNHYTINVNVAPGGNLREAGRLTVEAIKAFEKGSGPGWRK